jgi:hypothetical protein
MGRLSIGIRTCSANRSTRWTDKSEGPDLYRIARPLENFERPFVWHARDSEPRRKCLHPPPYDRHHLNHALLGQTQRADSSEASKEGK